MKRVISSETSATRWRELLDVNNYDISEMRRNNVTVGQVKKWLELFNYYGIDTDLDINLYAIEFAMRSGGR